MSNMGKYCEIWNVLVNLQSEIYYLSYLLLACVAFFLFVYVGTESCVGRNYQLDFTGFMYLFVLPFTQCGFSCLISQKGSL